MDLPNLFAKLAVGFSVYDGAVNGDYHCVCDFDAGQALCENCQKVSDARQAMDDGLQFIAGRHAGATGAFPQGQLNAEDEGELQVRVALDPEENVIAIDLGKPVAWIAFSAEEACALAGVLIERADTLRKLRRPPDNPG